jgi:hypothetical protein
MAAESAMSEEKRRAWKVPKPAVLSFPRKAPMRKKPPVADAEELPRFSPLRWGCFGD